MSRKSWGAPVHDRYFKMKTENPNEPRWNAICLHGALQSREVFDPLISYFQEHLSERFGQAIAVDLPGHGEAEESRVRFTPDALARFVLDSVPEAIFARPTLIVAQSFSGVAAMTIQGLRKEIAGVVMLDTPLNNMAAREAVLLLRKRYREDTKKNAWIGDLLEDFFACTMDRGFLSSVDYHDCIVDADVPVAMITGSEKKTSVVFEGDGSGAGPEAEAKLVSGTFEEISSLARQYPDRVRLHRSAACFGDRDVAILEQKNATNLEVYVIAGRGHNILTDEFVPLIGSTVGKFADKCLARPAEPAQARTP